MFIKLQQRGDTIVEVLIAIAIMTAVLSTAYAITNNSVKSNQESQEHGVALKLAESQLEQLKSYLKANPTATLPNTFCMYTASNTTNVETITGTVPNTDFTVYPANCKLDEGTAVDRYNAAVVRNGDAYTVYVDWDGPKGVISSESLVYRVY